MNAKQATKIKLENSPHYFYIRIIDALFIVEQQNQNKTVKTGEIIFRMSNKSCRTKFDLQVNKDNNQTRVCPKKTLKALREETHLMSYEAEEFLNIQTKITVEVPQTREQRREQEKNKDKQKDKTQRPTKGSKKNEIYQQTFSRVLLTPLTILPYTCHRVKVNLIKTNQKKQFSPVVRAKINLQIYYMLKFKAELLLYPIGGYFERAATNLGEMNLCFVAKVNETKAKSIVDNEGGIHPQWHNLYVKQKKIKVKSDKQQPFPQNVLRLPLNSVGNYLDISVVNFPIIDKDAQVVGQARLRIQNQDIMRVCNNKLNLDRVKQVNLFYRDPNEGNIDSGRVQFAYSFNFDIKGLREDMCIDSSSGDQNSSD